MPLNEAVHKDLAELLGWYIKEIRAAGADDTKQNAVEKAMLERQLQLAKKHLGPDLHTLGLDVRLKESTDLGPAGRPLHEVEIYDPLTNNAVNPDDVHWPKKGA